MRLDRSVVLLLLSIILGSGWVPARAGDSPAELALKEKGLARSGHTFVIEDEKPVLAKLKEIRGVYASYATVADRQATAEQVAQQSTQLEQQRVELQSNLDVINQQIAIQGTMQGNGTGGAMPRGRNNQQQTAANNPLMAQRNQVMFTLAEVNQTQKVLKPQVLPPKAKESLDDDVKKKQDAFKTALMDLRKEVDTVTKKYADLGADETVKKSIDDLKKASKAKVNLGPSDPFLAGVKELDQAERQFLGKRTTPVSRKKAAKSKK